MTGHKLIKAVVAGIVLASTGTGAAYAVPSYGYAHLAFTGFTLGGVTPTDVNTSVSGQDSAIYPGFALGGDIQSGTVGSGVDPLQGTSGPGPFPGQNTFTQALLPASALSPAGTRGDVLITGPLGGGASSDLVAEGKLSKPSASAGSSSGTTTIVDITFSAGNTGPVTLDFSASSQLSAIVHNFGDSASAKTSASFTVRDLTTGTDLFITGNNTDSPSGTLIAPVGLNGNVATQDPGSPGSFTSGPIVYSFTSAPLTSGHSYEINLQDTTQVILKTGAAQIPEPASLGLLGSGIMAIALLRRRRNRNS